MVSCHQETNVVSFHLKLSNGIEMTKENANLGGLKWLLQSFSADSLRGWIGLMLLCVEFS